LRKSKQALNCFLKEKRKAVIEFNGRTLFYHMDEKVKFQQEKTYSKNLQVFQKVVKSL